MNEVIWEVFKKTGSLEAYLYLSEQKKLNSEIESCRENIIDDDFEHPGDCT